MRNRPPRKSAFRRIMEKVHYVDPNTWEACILFIGSRNPRNGYGQIRYWDEAKQRWTVRGVHQVAFEHYHGYLPRWPVVVRHVCYDNRNCINERHLIPGDSEDNNNDIIERRKEQCPEYS